MTLDKPIKHDTVKKLAKLLPGSVYQKEADKGEKKKDLEKVFNKKNMKK